MHALYVWSTIGQALGSASTLFRLGWLVYNFLMLNFLAILYTKKLLKSVHFSPNYLEYIKGERFFETQCSYRAQPSQKSLSRCRVAEIDDEKPRMS